MELKESSLESSNSDSYLQIKSFEFGSFHTCSQEGSADFASSAMTLSKSSTGSPRVSFANASSAAKSAPSPPLKLAA